MHWLGSIPSVEFEKVLQEEEGFVKFLCSHIHMFDCYVTCFEKIDVGIFVLVDSSQDVTD